MCAGSRSLAAAARFSTILSASGMDSTDPMGVSQSLLDSGVVEQYVESVAFNDLHPSIALDLPRNQTVVLRIQQTGRGANWWSIYELKLWERKEERSINTSTGSLAILLLATAATETQQHQHPAATAPPATLVAGMGRLHHPIATKNAEAQGSSIRG